MTQVAIIDYGSGNLRSVAKAFEKVVSLAAPPSHDAALRSASAPPRGESRILVTSDPQALKTATHLVLPGVGAFADCVAGLSAIPGMRAAMEAAVFTRKIPFLGICVGMQMLMEKGFEHGEHDGLGWIKGDCVKLSVEEGTTPPPPLRGRDGVGGLSVARQWMPPPPHPSPARGEGDSPSSQLGTRHSALKIPHMGWNDLHLTQPTHPLLAGIREGEHAYFVHSYHVLPTEGDAVLATVDYGGPVTAIVAKGNIMGAQFHPEKSQATGLRLIANFLGTA